MGTSSNDSMNLKGKKETKSQMNSFVFAIIISKVAYNL